jgi:hypothetical protein
MHHALLLPEIVSAIVRAGLEESGLLYSCLFVNKLFWYETCRVLWESCYGYYDEVGVSNKAPKVCHLGNMVRRPDIGAQRAQVYANFIRVLVFQRKQIPGRRCAMAFKAL